MIVEVSQTDGLMKMELVVERDWSFALCWPSRRRFL